MEEGGAAGNREEESDGGEDSDNDDIGKGQSPPPTNDSARAPENRMANLQHESSVEMELEETMEEPALVTGLEDQPEAVQSRTSISSAKSYKESEEEIMDSSPEYGSDVISSVEMMALFPPQTTETPSTSTGAKAHPTILGSVRREHPAISHLSGGALDPIATDTHQEHSEVSVAVQTEASWLFEHVFKRKAPKKKRRLPRENDIYAVLSQDLSNLDILCDTEFKEDFLKLFKESLRTLSSVGPPTILAYRPESSRENVYIEVEKDFAATCEFCGNPLRHYPSFESLEEIAKYAYLFCCQEYRELHEFIVIMQKQCTKPEFQQIDISPNQVHGSESERQLARERALQRQKEKQLARQLAYLANEQTRDIIPGHGFEQREVNHRVVLDDLDIIIGIISDNKLLKTISYSLSQESDWTRMPIQYSAKRESEDVSYSISYCDFTLAGGKLVKNQFLQQYYKNGVKFLTMFPNGTAQIFYPSGNLAIMVIPKNENAPSICIVQEDKSENADIQAVFDSSGRGTCYHPNGNVWINITIRGGHYSDQYGSKVKAWIWPNNLQKKSPKALFKPVFLALNLNVGVRILTQDKLSISFLAMGKQAKISIGTKVELLPGHHPWPKHVSEDDLLLFASRIKILRIFAKLHGCLDFPTSDWGPKVQLPSYILKWAARLTNLCKDCEINTALDNLIAEIINSPA